MVAILFQGHAADAGFRVKPVNPTGDGRPGFTQLAANATGITFSNRLSESTIEKNRILENGSGAAAGDVDGDGLCDLYFCGLENSNVLYRNLGGWRFEDITDTAGVACAGQYSSGAALADVDGDGDLDLLVNSIGGGTRLFLNDGRGRFTESLDAGLARSGGSHSMTLADVDGDGDLDLYVANYRATTFKDLEEPTKVRLRSVNGVVQVPPERAEQFAAVPSGDGYDLVEIGEPDVLYLNDGKGRFTPVAWNSGRFLGEDGRPLAAPLRDWGLAAAFRDLNGDGAPDLYVCNDFFSPDRLWFNDGRGNFRAAPRLALRKTSWASMTVDFADINRDGQVDFVVADMLSRSHVSRQVQRNNFELSPFPWWGWPADRDGIEARPQALRNTLQLGRGDGTWAEIAEYAGLAASEWTWNAAFLDVDLDGYEDLLVANGHPHDMVDSDALRNLEARQRGGGRGARDSGRSLFPSLRTANLAFRNGGDLRFAEVGEAWGFNTAGVSQGLALADLDNDGDLDVVLNNLNGVAGVYRNDTKSARVSVRLRGSAPNTHGIGARITVRGGAVPEQTQEIQSGGRYLSSDDAVRVFAAGDPARRLEIAVRWRSGRETVLKDVAANQRLELDEAASVQGAARVGMETRPWFEEPEGGQLAVPHEEAFDDFARQPLLPRRLSQLGPGVAWCDLDGDGREDLLIGSGKGGRLGAWINAGQGHFRPVTFGKFTAGAPDDLTGIVAWNSEAGHSTVLVGVANYESRRTNTAGALRHESFFGTVDSSAAVPGSPWSTGPLAVADIDGDGDLDLFVGGRVVPGRYPEPASSRLFRNVGGRFQPDSENAAVMDGLGLVSGVVWTDLDGDGFPELVVAVEWGPVRIFRNEHGRLRETTRELGMDRWRGWWNGVTAGDFNGDGRMDLAVSNWGRNSRDHAYLSTGLRVYSGDVDANGTWDVVEEAVDPLLKREVPLRDYRLVGQSIGGIVDRFTTYAAFGSATISDLLGDSRQHLRVLDVTTLESTIFLNTGNGFEALPLPSMAQFAPAFGISVSDFDGDGKEDLFLAQNFFGTDHDTARHDAGLGLCLQGDGRGGFRALGPLESGIRVPGEQRGSAVADFDGDGRPDLVVAQNSAPARVFRNALARPGLRVRLVGPAGNVPGIGAQLRWTEESYSGPIRELHGGAGYWSQDSTTTVLARGKGAGRLTVRWPGGRSVEYPVAAGVLEVEAGQDGNLRVIR